MYLEVHSDPLQSYYFYSTIYSTVLIRAVTMKRKLTDRAVKTLKTKEKPYRSPDGGNLYLLVKPNGSKLWRYDCAIHGNRITLSFGEYPSVTLAEARELHGVAIKNIAKGIDPRTNNTDDPLDNPFSFFAKDTINRQQLTERTALKKIQTMDKYLFKVLDTIPLKDITAIHLLNLIQPVADAGKKETAKRLATYCSQTFITLMRMQLITNNPAESISKLLPKLDEPINFIHITDINDFTALIKGADTYGGDFAVRAALQLMPLVFLRPKNIRFLKWEHIDFEKKLITYPAEEMKMTRAHKVPLSEQAIQIIESMKPITGAQELVFSTAIGKGKQMSENTLNVAIARIKHPATGEKLGKGFMTSHGFRHSASTFLNELRFDADAIEIQLAHLDKDRIRRTYNKAELLTERTLMMQSWADYLDGLKRGGDVVPIHKYKS